MKKEIKVPAVGESISEATVAEWSKRSGDYVEQNEILLVLETDKASVEVVAEHSGQLTVSVQEGETVEIGAVLGLIDMKAKTPKSLGPPSPPIISKESSFADDATTVLPLEKLPKLVDVVPDVAPMKPSEMISASSSTLSSEPSPLSSSSMLSPAVRKIVAEKGLQPKSLVGSGKGGRLTKADVLSASAIPSSSSAAATQDARGRTSTEEATFTGEQDFTEESSTMRQMSADTSVPPLPQVNRSAVGESIRKEKMTALRKTIALRLVEAQQTAAILTTFNEVDMTATQELRRKYKENFKEKYGMSFGFMGIFVKAAIAALKEFPRVNAHIEGDEIIYKNFVNMGIAVSTDKGLLVPVIRHVDQLSLSEIELSIRHYALKAREGKISINDLKGGTFTISNGGVFGSLMSTPILNPPQSGILGLHKVENRPVAVEGKVAIRPMMYVALSYDHRIIDGRESVGFLVKVKEGVEDPSRLLLDV